MRYALKNHMTFLFVLLFAVIVFVWGVFYMFISRSISDNTRKQLAFTVQKIMADLGAEFENLDRVSYALANLDEVKAFVKEKDLQARFARAKNIGEFLNHSSFNPSFTGNVLIYDSSGRFYRFAGKLSNTSCAYLGHMLQKINLPEHINVQLEGNNYIGYGMGVTDDGNQTGTIVLLIEEAKLHELFYAYAPDNGLAIAIAAGNEIIAANSTQLTDITHLDNANTLMLEKKQIGITPFEIIVSANKNYLRASYYYFTAANGVTLLAFTLVLFAFAKVQNKRFFVPIYKIIQNMEALEYYSGQNALPPTDNTEFDGLVNKINDMLCRLDKKNEEVVRSQLLLKNAEIEKQKAIINALKKQINAHFTINTLNNIKILVKQSRLENAEAVIDDLSDMIRYAYSKDETINVWDEFALLAQYVAIMNIRYNNKIELRFDVDDRLMDSTMPRMLLQPIVENAVVHGFKNMEQGCVIEVCAQLLPGRNMRITIRDNGEGMNAQACSALLAKINATGYESGGIENIALVNIKNRLMSQYGPSFNFQMQSTYQKGTLVTIEIEN